VTLLVFILGAFLIHPCFSPLPVSEAPKANQTETCKCGGKRSESQTCFTLPPKKRRAPFSEIGNTLGLIRPDTVPVRPGDEIDEIDLPDVCNVLSGVQYVKELYLFYDKQQVVFNYFNNFHRITSKASITLN
jgi:hypothetical protein